MEKIKKEYSILKNETKCSDYNSDTPLSPGKLLNSNTIAVIILLK